MKSNQQPNEVPLKGHKMISKEALRGAIQWECQNSNLTLNQIAEKFKVSKMTVIKWKKRDYVNAKERNRKCKANKRHIAFIKKMGDGKYTGIEQASCRMIAAKLIRHFNKGLKSIKFSLGKSTVNKILNQVLSKPRKTKQTFRLYKKDKIKRIDFIKYIKQMQINGKDIFFTDESRFLLDTPLNPQTNQIRFNQEDLAKLRSGEEKLYEKLHVPLPKYTTGFMVAGGISYYGVGKLIFCVGTMNTNCYLPTLNYFKEDIQRLSPNLYFQQDGAKCHWSRKSMEKIVDEFPNHLESWPSNSPDLSPIEEIWSQIKEKVSERKHKSLDDLKRHVVFLWNRIPVSLCRKLIRRFNRKIKVIKDTGERINTLPPRKIKERKKKRIRMKLRIRWEKKWNIDNHDDTIERIVFNDKNLAENKKRAIKAIKKQLTELRKQYKKYNKEVLTDKQIKHYHRNDYRQMKKALAEKKKEKQKWNQKFDAQKTKIEALTEMTPNDWYESLKTELKMKMIRFYPVKGKTLLSDSNGETFAETQDLNQRDDNNNDVVDEAQDNEHA